MGLPSVTLLLGLLICADALKFLCYAPAIGRSHVNYLGKLSDALADAGHEVVILMPMTANKTVGMRASYKARIVTVPQCEAGKQMELDIDKDDGGLAKNSWSAQTPFHLFLSILFMGEPLMQQCNATIHHPGLLEELRREKFDAAFMEMMDYCGVGVVKLLGIEKFAITMSSGSFEGGFFITGAPDFPSYVPSALAGHSDQMTFFERIDNLFNSLLMHVYFPVVNWPTEDLFKSLHPDLGSLWGMYSEASLVFLNSDPLIDFPVPTSHKMIHIGGISAQVDHKPLNQTWSSILSLRPKTVLLSFGSVAKSFLMPEEYKQSIRAAFKKFPEVTFIWKYEAPQDRMSEGIPNLVEATWVPQNDLLYDPRLSLFITHCGSGSTMEATRAGKPLIVIPVMGDQQRNAEMVKRMGTGIVIDKNDLLSSVPLENAIRNALSTDRYRKKAEYTSEVLQHRPFAVKELFVKNMEFMARYGPLKMLDHYSTNLNFIQYYLIDVFALLAAVALVAFASVTIAIRCIVKKLFGRGKEKVQ